MSNATDAHEEAIDEVVRFEQAMKANNSHYRASVTVNSTDASTVGSFDWQIITPDSNVPIAQGTDYTSADLQTSLIAAAAQLAPAYEPAEAA